MTISCALTDEMRVQGSEEESIMKILQAAQGWAAIRQAANLLRKRSSLRAEARARATFDQHGVSVHAATIYG